jgi:tRNA A-37 threonylcarbamoyl transferase component Bud32
MAQSVATVLTPERLRPLDLACDSFERLWMEGQRPTIEDHLQDMADGLRSLVRDELIRLELEWRYRAGERPARAEYVQRFPECAGDIEGWLAEAEAAAAVWQSTLTADPVAAPTEDVQDTPPAASTMPRAGPAVETMLGRQLGEYDLLEPLGQGGMGEVWKARHRRLDKLVAIKLLHAHRQTSQVAVERFLREMKALGRLDHPNVVEASDAGEQSGVVYLVMKLVEGTDLARLVRDGGPLSTAEACALVRQAALGLQYLHEHGLVHRDIKPSNLIRTPDGTVKVLDLGLASWRGAAPTEDLTLAGQLLGTPDFLAPEQVRDAAAVDIRADLYSLGATLFFLLTGKPPFAHRTGVYAKMKAHEEEAPPDIPILRPDVPAELAALVARLLAKRPEYRPQTPAEVAGQLSDGCDDHTVPVPRELVPAAAARSRWFSPWAWAGATAGLALLLAMIVPPALKNRPVFVPTALHEYQHGPAPAPEPLRVLALDVTHFATVRRGGKDFECRRGLLGRDSFSCRLDDQVTLEGRLSRPAYAYLIAYRPDGTEELCFPEQEDQPPPRSDRPRYPSVRRGEQYGLNEGTGLAVFAVVASSQPLPAYRDWRKQRGASPWKHDEARAGVVWYDNGASVDAQMDEHRVRGKGQAVMGQTSLVRLTDWLWKAPDVEAVTAVGFAVLPKEQP